MRIRSLIGRVMLAAALSAGAGAAGAGERQALFTLSAGLHHVFDFGTVEDYARGFNDFPVTPAHRSLQAGLAFGRVSGRWLFEVEARWIGSSTVVLEDPSDGDTITVPTSPRAVASLAVFFLPLRGRIRPYLGGSAGVDVVLAGETEATSRGGFDIRIPAPAFKDRFDPILQAGGGLLVALGGRIGLRLDGRYVWVWERPEAVRGVQASLALTLAL